MTNSQQQEIAGRERPRVGAGISRLARIDHTLSSLFRRLPLRPRFSGVFSAMSFGRTASAVLDALSKPLKRFGLSLRLLITPLKRGVTETGARQRSRECEVCGLAVALGLCLTATVTALAADQPPPLFADAVAGVRIRKPVTTFKEFKERRVVKQRYDFSCGAAALATVLREYYKLPVTEEGIVAYIIHKRGEEEAVRRYKEKKGFSLLDLKMAASSIAFRCAAYSEMTLADLLEVDAPVIVPIRTREYDHFVVFRGLRDDRVYLTDPVSGNITMKATNFQAVWKDGVGMALKSRKGLQPTDWQPEHNAQGFYVARDQVRSLMRSSAVSVFRGPREF